MVFRTDLIAPPDLCALVEPINLAHFNEECESPGYSILISFGGPYGNVAAGQCCGQTVDLGEVALESAQNGWTLTDEASEHADA